jgi:hypothetical protein
MHPTFRSTAGKALSVRNSLRQVVNASTAAKVSQAAAKATGVLGSAALTASLLLGAADAANLQATSPVEHSATVQQYTPKMPLAFLGFGEDKSIKLPDGTKLPLDQLPPGIDAKAVKEAVKVLEKNPEAAKEAMQQAKQLTEVFSDPNVQQKFGKLAEDPDLKSFFEDVKSQGPGAFQKYYNDTNFLSKLSSKMSAAGLGPEIFQKDGGSILGGASGPINNLADAAKAGDMKALKNLVAKGNVDQRDDKGVTPLGLAVGFDQVSAIKELLKSGANPNATDKKGNTPLHYAAAYGRKEAAKLLLEAGAKPNIKNSDGKTPADGARTNNKKDVLTLLAKS